MPQLDDLIAKRQNKKFVKKNYRPWDLKGSGTNNETSGNTDNIDTNNSDNQNLSLPKVTTSTPRTIKHTELIPSGINNNTAKDAQKQHFAKEQLDNIQVTDKVTIREQLDNIQVTDKVTIREQLDNTLDPHSLQNQITKLSGIQKKILYFIADICTAKESIETGPIETKVVASYIDADYGSTKTSLNRLINKNLLSRKKGKTAKGGFINLSIPEKVRNTIFQIRKVQRSNTNPAELIKLLKAKLDNNIDNKVHISSSSNNITTTKQTLPIEWKKINIDPLSKIGFSETQLKQLFIDNLNTAEIVQESIYHFAYGLENTPKTQEYRKLGKNPLNVLMGVLRKGQGWFEANYQSAQELAQEQFLKHKKIEKERLKKLEEEAYQLAFEEWYESLTTEQIDKIAPKKQGRGDFTPQPVKLSIYFKEHVWPDRKKGYLVSGK